MLRPRSGGSRQLCAPSVLRLAPAQRCPALSGRVLGSFLSLSPEYTFVLEDEGGPCGYAAGALCAERFLRERDSSWLPAMQHRYPRELGVLGQVRV